MDKIPLEIYVELMTTIRHRLDVIETIRQSQIDDFSRAETAAFHGRSRYCGPCSRKMSASSTISHSQSEIVHELVDGVGTELFGFHRQMRVEAGGGRANCGPATLESGAD